MSELLAALRAEEQIRLEPSHPPGAKSRE